MKVLVGLGNPGTQYAGNRHNVGFMAVERIATRHSLGIWRKQFGGLVAAGEIDGERVLLVKPQTFYNEAGRCVSAAIRFHKLSVDDLIVFHDEIDLAPGKLRIKSGGGHAGNNGLRSIISHLSADFTRVRIGVGHPGHKDQVARYVLHDFPKADRLWLEELLDAIAASAGRLASGDTERFQTDVAQKLSSILKAGKTDTKPDTTTPGTTDGLAPSQTAGIRRAKPSAKARSAGKGTAKTKSGMPSPQDLARLAARPSPGRSEAPTDASPRDTNASDDPGTALGDRLKRWLRGRTDNNT